MQKKPHALHEACPYLFIYFFCKKLGIFKDCSLTELLISAGLLSPGAGFAAGCVTGTFTPIVCFGIGVG